MLNVGEKIMTGVDTDFVKKSAVIAKYWKTSYTPIAIKRYKISHS